MSVIWGAIKAIRVVKADVEGDQPALRKQFVDENNEERQWLRGRALDMIRSAKFYLERLSEGMLEDIHNRLQNIVSGVSVDLSDLSDSINRARDLLVHLELQMEKEKPDTEMVKEICGRLDFGEQLPSVSLIAGRAGVTRETESRVINRWVMAGILGRVEGKLVILKPERLALTKPSRQTVAH